MIPLVGALIPLAEKVFDKIFPDKEAADKAKLEMLKLQQEGEFKEMEASYQAIIAEASSQDKWTSRARPSFMYVMYVMLLTSIPMGVTHAYDPTLATNIIDGVGAWFHAIPQDLYWLFGTGYLGYSASRSFDKKKILEAK